MTSSSRATAVRLVALVAAIAVVSAAAAFWLVNRDDGSTPTGWKTVMHEGVEVEIPASWERVDMDDCEWSYPAWRPPELRGCDWMGGMMFVGSATHDPAHGPGVRHVNSPDEPAWGGYTEAGENFVVYAGDDDRKIVQRVLESVR